MVIDASFAVNWLMVRDGSSRGQQVIDISREGIAAPIIFWHEIASALRNIAHRKLINIAQRDIAIGQLEQLMIATDRDAPGIMSTLRLSDRYNLTVYDASYLELAIRLGGRLATSDAALTQAAQRCGIEAIGID